MSTRRFETVVTVTVGTDERDCSVRGRVLLEPGLGMGGGWGAQIDGTPEVRIGRSWVDADVAELGEGDIARCVEALEEMALNDDRDQCVDHDDERECA